jgi:hypothetical protein
MHLGRINSISWEMTILNQFEDEVFCLEAPKDLYALSRGFGTSLLHRKEGKVWEIFYFHMDFLFLG